MYISYLLSDVEIFSSGDRNIMEIWILELTPHYLSINKSILVVAGSEAEVWGMLYKYCIMTYTPSFSPLFRTIKFKCHTHSMHNNIVT